MEPGLAQVIKVIRESSGHHRKPINGNSLIEDDLHICGDDGADLLEACEQAFTISFNTHDKSLRERFSLAENEYLFTSEGLDPFGIGLFINWLRGIPRPFIRDVTVDELHRVIVEAVKEQTNSD